MCVLVCVWVGGVLLIIFYSPQAPMKRAWNPLLLQIYITEQCESLFKKTDHLWKAALTNNGFDGWTEWIQSFFRLNVNQSITWCRCQFSMLFILYYCLNGNVTTHFFFNFLQLKHERKRVHFSPYDFFFIILIYTGAWNRKMYSLALIYL